MTLLNVAHLLCRLCLALSLLTFAIDGMAISAPALRSGTRGLHQIEWMAVITLSALLMVIAVWLIFGLRSRVVALLGLVIFAGQLFWFNALDLQTTYGVWHLVLSIGLAGPLLVLGGGYFAIYKRGWKVPV